MTILLSVLIEGWKTRYSTAINSSKSGVTLADRMRKLQLRSRAAQAQKKAAEAKANGEAPAQSPIVAEPEEDDRDIATKLLDSARGFSRHAQYWMNYKSGNPPEELQRLVDETDELAGQEDMKELRAIAQSAPEGSTQDLLFVISYARKQRPFRILPYCRLMLCFNRLVRASPRVCGPGRRDAPRTRKGARAPSDLDLTS